MHISPSRCSGLYIPLAAGIYRSAPYSYIEAIECRMNRFPSMEADPDVEGNEGYRDGRPGHRGDCATGVVPSPSKQDV